MQRFGRQIFILKYTPCQYRNVLSFISQLFVFNFFSIVCVAAFICVCLHVCVCVPARVWIIVCLYVCMCAFVYIFECCVCVCLCVCMEVCVCLNLSIWEDAVYVWWCLQTWVGECLWIWSSGQLLVTWNGHWHSSKLSHLYLLHLKLILSQINIIWLLSRTLFSRFLILFLLSLAPCLLS